MPSQKEMVPESLGTGNFFFYISTMMEKAATSMLLRLST
jgi:hypothetical protein